MSLKVAVGVSRLPFLTLTPACVFLGVAFAWYEHHAFSFSTLGVTLVGSLAAHVCVNALNEYQDFVSGLDMKTRRTPFSGGSGTLPANPKLQKIALAVALASLTLVVMSGLVIIRLSGPAVLPLGLLGIPVIIFYTGWINRHPFACLLAPGVGFGPLMTLGSYVAMTGYYTLPAVAVSLVPMLLVSNVLLLNQFPDVSADQSIGRRHLPIVAGKAFSAKVWTSLFLLAHALVVAYVYLAWLPVLSMIALLPLLLGFSMIPGVLRNLDNEEALIPFMGMNVAVAHLTPILLIASLFLQF